ncbi:hypothetical protein LUZ60_002704 [Juncus effusus]|nr:hypothetical protein LUZ60_002704 [Juncus effusus]
MASNPDEDIVFESMPCIRIFKSGRVERYIGSEFVPPGNDSTTGVLSKDVTIQSDTGVAARLYLPKIIDSSRKIPIVVYYHGGGFCLGSAFNQIFHEYFNKFVEMSNVLVVSVEYRLAPEHPVPVAYADSWAALQWVASHFNGTGPDPWISDHADLGRVFLGGESCGANIAHHMTMRAGVEALKNGMKINGLALIHPYFLGSDSVVSEDLNPEVSKDLVTLWKVMCPETTGLDDPLINPFVVGAPKLDGLACGRVFICVAGMDTLRDRGKMYYDKLKESGWKGEVELKEIPGVGHTFHLLNMTSDEAIQQDRSISAFLNC